MQVKPIPALRAHDTARQNSGVSRGTMEPMTDKTTQKRAYRKTPKCPHCGQPITRAQIAAMLSAQRTTRRGGRPTQGERCPCGAMSIERAKARNHHCTAKEPPSVTTTRKNPV
jgi:hypothetical protein